MKLWHCNAARSLRPVWALEEMGLEGLELDEIPAGKVPDAQKDAGPWTVLKVKETT